MSDWATCAVLDSFTKMKVGRKHQILARDIAQTGEFPVVDQGQEFIAGYCDDREKLIDFDLPLVIFGDHTRCFKYVDFPFVLGADGTKVLAPNKDLYDPKFYYFALMALEIPSRGYNRHFKMLKERSLPLPPLPEQKKIAHILSTVQRAIEAQERIIQTTTELKKTLMHKLFPRRAHMANPKNKPKSDLSRRVGRSLPLRSTVSPPLSGRGSAHLSIRLTGTFLPSAQPTWKMTGVLITAPPRKYESTTPNLKNIICGKEMWLFRVAAPVELQVCSRGI